MKAEESRAGCRYRGRVHPGTLDSWSAKPDSFSSSGSCVNPFPGAEALHERGACRFSPRTGSGLGTPRRDVLWMLCTHGVRARASQSAWACFLARGRGAALRPLTFSFSTNPTKAVLSIFHGLALSVVEGQDVWKKLDFPQADWKAAASQSEPGPDPPRCGQRRRVRRL